MLDPNPSIADLDAMLDRHRNDDAAMEKIIRGYLRCAIYSYQKGSVAKIVKLEHAWRRLDGRNDDGFQVAPFPG